jgi:hypothetical protein
VLEKLRFVSGAGLAITAGAYVLISGMGYFIGAWGLMGMLLLLAIPFWLPVAPLVPWLLTGVVPQLFLAAWLALWAGALVSGAISPMDIWNAVVRGKV